MSTKGSIEVNNILTDGSITLDNPVASSTFGSQNNSIIFNGASTSFSGELSRIDVFHSDNTDSLNSSMYIYVTVGTTPFNIAQFTSNLVTINSSLKIGANSVFGHNNFTISSAIGNICDISGSSIRIGYTNNVNKFAIETAANVRVINVDTTNQSVIIGGSSSADKFRVNASTEVIVFGVNTATNTITFGSPVTTNTFIFNSDHFVLGQLLTINGGGQMVSTATLPSGAILPNPVITGLTNNTILQVDTGGVVVGSNTISNDILINGAVSQTKLQVNYADNQPALIINTDVSDYYPILDLIKPDSGDTLFMRCINPFNGPNTKVSIELVVQPTPNDYISSGFSATKDGLVFNSDIFLDVLAGLGGRLLSADNQGKLTTTTAGIATSINFVDDIVTYIPISLTNQSTSGTANITIPFSINGTVNANLFYSADGFKFTKDLTIQSSNPSAILTFINSTDSANIRLDNLYEFNFSTGIRADYARMDYIILNDNIAMSKDIIGRYTPITMSNYEYSYSAEIAITYGMRIGPSLSIITPKIIFRNSTGDGNINYTGWEFDAGPAGLNDRYKRVITLKCPPAIPYSGPAIVFEGNQDNGIGGVTQVISKLDFNGYGFHVDSSFYPGTPNSLDFGGPGDAWRNVYLSGGVIVVSDSAFKTDIMPTNLGLNFINRLNPVKYKYTYGTSGRTHHGLIAQEVEATMAQMFMSTNDFAGYVRGRERTLQSGNLVDHDVRMLRYEEFIAPMIKAIQELSSRLSALESQ